jgi:hypothetical protein
VVISWSDRWHLSGHLRLCRKCLNFETYSPGDPIGMLVLKIGTCFLVLMAGGSVGGRGRFGLLSRTLAFDGRENRRCPPNLSAEVLEAGNFGRDAVA